MKQYGMPYKGSKNSIAEWLISQLPESKYFVDLFGGGGAMSHCAALSYKYKKVIYNELEPLVYKAFKMAVNGEFKDEKRWISREDFSRLKDTDPYVAICFSFGNGLKTYAYSKEIEPWKKAVHYARIFGDYTKLKQFGIESDGSRSDIKAHKEEYKEKYIAWYMKNVMKSEKEYRLEKQELEKNIKDEIEKLRSYLINARSLESLERLQRLERLESLERLQRLERLESLEISTYNLSYEIVPIPENSVVYCDIPYKGTKGYLNKFDHEKFYKWALNQPFDVYISEYDMPKEFYEVAKVNKRCTLGVGNKTKTVEKLFCNRKPQKEMWEQMRL